MSQRSNPSHPQPLRRPYTTETNSLAVAITVIFGLLAVYAGLFSDNGALLVFFILCALTVFLVWNTPAVLRRQRVIDRWDLVIPDANGRSDDVIGDTFDYIDARNPPDVRLALSDLAPGFWRSLSADTRPFLIAQNDTNRRIRSYCMFVNVRDYGEALQTSWYLAYHPTIWQRFRGQENDLDLFDEQDLRAYVSIVHQSFLHAVIDLLGSLGKDTAINRTSKGFLGVS